jgi:sigma-B regulation protein RsbQ
MNNIMKKLIFLFILLTAAASAYAQKAVEAKDKFAKYGDVKVHYRDEGRGKDALIFVHCWGCNMQFWKDQFGAYPQYRTIFLDLPGHGQSDKPNTEYTMEYFARAVEAVMRDAGVKHAVLVGHSMGAPVIRNFYKLYPEKTLGLVSVDGPLRLGGTKEENEQFMAQMKANYKLVVSQFLDFITSKATPELRGEIKAQMLATPESVGLSAMKYLNDPQSYPADKINVPVMALLADYGVWPPDTEDFLRSIAPKLKIHKWQGVDHFLMMEKPKVFTQSVGIFISTNNLL